MTLSRPTTFLSLLISSALVGEMKNSSLSESKLNRRWTRWKDGTPAGGVRASIDPLYLASYRRMGQVVDQYRGMYTVLLNTLLDVSITILLLL